MNLPGVPKGPAPLFTHGKRKGRPKDFLGLETRWELTYRVDPRLILGQRRLRKMRRNANRDVMLYWHENMRDTHFTHRGGRKYKYARRTFVTNKLKREMVGHLLPLRKKGVAQSLSSNIKSLRVTADKGALTMQGPWYMGQRVQRKQGGLSPDLKDELTRTDIEDAMKLAELGGEYIQKQIEDDRARGIGARVKKG